MNPIKKLSHCQCHRLTSKRTGWFELLLIALVPHFDITKTIGTEVTCYLRRFYLFRAKWFGLEKYLGDLYLHHIIRSDDDPDPHDHPWGFTGFILAGGYQDESYSWELAHLELQQAVSVIPERELVTFGERLLVSVPARRHGPFYEKVRPLTFIRRAAKHIHRVIVPPGKTAWTIIATERRSRDWNFITVNGPVLWRTYLGIPGGVDVGE